MFSTVLCVAYACLSVSAATSWYQGCNITKLMTPTFLGIKPTFHLVNKKYGKVQRSVCPRNAIADCLTFASHAQDAMLFIMDSAYPGSVYFFLYEANDDGTFVKDQSGLPLSLGSLENYSSAGVAVVLHTDTSDDRDALRVEYYSGTETCLLTFGFSNRMLSAQLSGYDDSGPMAKLIQDYKSYVPKQQWSFELTTDINTQFNRLDRNSDGELSLDEYGNVTDPVVLQSGDTITYLLNSFIIYDNNSDGFVTRDEQKAYMKKYYADHKDALMKLILEYIKDFDENNDSRLQSDELKLYLASSARVLTKDSFTASFTRYDKNGDKGLDGDELYDMRIGFSDETHHLIPMRVLPPFDKTSTLHY